MLNWYRVEDNGNVLVLSSENQPSWFQFEEGHDGWKRSLKAAIDEVRVNFEHRVESAERDLSKARADLERFLAVQPVVSDDGAKT